MKKDKQIRILNVVFNFNQRFIYSKVSTKYTDVKQMYKVTIITSYTISYTRMIIICKEINYRNFT